MTAPAPQPQGSLARPADGHSSQAPAVNGHPLVVDLDGTLTPTDTLVESVLALVKARPLMLLHLLWWLLRGRANFKLRVAAHHPLDVDTLPWREEFLAWVRQQRAGGRTVVLATAAHVSIAQRVSARLGLFDAVLATDAAHNLKGVAKLEAIRAHVGADFVYAGDSQADLPIWAAARGAVLVGASLRTSAQARRVCPVEAEFQRAPVGWRVWLKAIRAHQWLKNLLLFVPLFTSFNLGDPTRAGLALLAFVSFSLAASATYLMNDLWDLESDRQHPRKRFRPMASGAVPLHLALLAAAGLLALALVAGLLVSGTFTVMLLGYVALTTAYSWLLKGYVLLDVLTLALLYTYRVLAGGVAVGLAVTPWLLAFSVFTFLSLALVKRCAELVGLAEAGERGTRGRDYRVSDLAVLWPLGVGSSLCSVVVFGLYIGTAEARAVYGDTPLMWLLGVVLIYWTGRMWIKTSRGEMHDDPIVFAIKDRGSRYAVVALVTLASLAHWTFRAG